MIHLNSKEIKGLAGLAMGDRVELSINVRVAGVHIDENGESYDLAIEGGQVVGGDLRGRKETSFKRAFEAEIAKRKGTGKVGPGMV